MTAFEASVRLGQVRYEDLAALVGDATVVLVRALTDAGATVDLELELTEAWAGVSGWRRMFACPVCSRPARVLGVGQTGAACGRCSPLRTRYQQKKNMRAWSSEGMDLVDRLRRHVEQHGHRRPSGGFMATARTLRCQSLRRLQHAMELARGVLTSTEGRQADEPPGSDVVEEVVVEQEIDLPPHFRPFECWEHPSPGR